MLDAITDEARSLRELAQRLEFEVSALTEKLTTEQAMLQVMEVHLAQARRDIHNLTMDRDSAQRRVNELEAAISVLRKTRHG